MELTQGQMLAKAALAAIKQYPSHWDQSEFWHNGAIHCFGGFVEILAQGGDVRQGWVSEDTRDVAMNYLGIGDLFADLLFDTDNSLQELEEYVAAFCGDIDGASHPDWRVRIAAAANPNLSPSQLDQLTYDEVWDVRLAAAQNPNLSHDQLDRLIKDKDSRVREAAQISKFT